eukprot:210516-Chlamydomonas_euryale.AAC.1
MDNPESRGGHCPYATELSTHPRQRLRREPLAVFALFYKLERLPNTTLDAVVTQCVSSINSLSAVSAGVRAAKRVEEQAKTQTHRACRPRRPDAQPRRREPRRPVRKLGPRTLPTRHVCLILIFVKSQGAPPRQ